MCEIVVAYVREKLTQKIIYEILDFPMYKIEKPSVLTSTGKDLRRSVDVAGSSDV